MIITKNNIIMANANMARASEFIKPINTRREIRIVMIPEAMTATFSFFCRGKK
jgi:hypothetical protein